MKRSPFRLTFSQGLEPIQNREPVVSDPPSSSGLTATRSNTIAVWTSSMCAPAQRHALMPSPVVPSIAMESEYLFRVCGCRVLSISSLRAYPPVQTTVPLLALILM